MNYYLLIGLMNIIYLKNDLIKFCRYIIICCYLKVILRFRVDDIFQYILKSKYCKNDIYVN